MELAWRPSQVGEPSALLKAKKAPKHTHTIGDCAQSWSPRGGPRPQHRSLSLSSVSSEGSGGVGEGVVTALDMSERRVENGTSGEVRLQDRGLVEIPVVAALLFVVLGVVTKGHKNFFDFQCRSPHAPQVSSDCRPRHQQDLQSPQEMLQPLSHRGSLEEHD